ncbi:hypothetical protein JYT74_03130 [Crocinitomix catalasitica]|nr:hypothetical protein [Crocinitomix catalasitica]
MILAFCVSCKKNKVEPVNQVQNATKYVIDCKFSTVDVSTYFTFESSPYIASYPGSWWTYDNGETYYSSGSDLVGFIQYELNSDGCTVAQIDSIFLPFQENLPYGSENGYGNQTGFGYILGDANVYVGSEPEDFSESTVRQLVDTVALVGEQFYYGKWNYSQGWHSITRWIEAKYDSLLVAGVYYYEVIRVHEVSETYISHLGHGPIDDWTYYFSKEVGLIKRDLWGSSGSDTLRLVDYYIAPH